MPTGDVVALVYMVLEGDEWEFGGLMVDNSARKNGLGSVLSRLALAHTIVYEQPWASKQTIIAHVHEANEAPRNLLKRLGFAPTSRVEIPGDKAPASMKRNAAGNVVGDKFQLTNKGLQHLARWFNEEFDGTCGISDSLVEFDLGPATIEDLRKALKDIAEANR